VTVFALATLGDATKNRNDPISDVPPKVAKACTVTIAVAGVIMLTLPMETLI
jgi:hypothetical protein